MNNAMQIMDSPAKTRREITVAGCDFAVEMFIDSDGDYIAICPVLDISTDAENEERAYDNIIEAVTLLLEATWDLGELQQELERRGVDPAIWEKVSKYYARTRGKTASTELHSQLGS